jgi:radical SAM superfamily enzyme YgiQ (UPF0313 family)
MKIDLYYIQKQLHFTSFAYPIVLDVLKIWAESIDWEARVYLSKESRVDFSTDADVVGISVYTATAPAAFRICRTLRREGKVVILGGPHFRGPDTYAEAAIHCDVIVNSICETAWKHLLQNIASGNIPPKNGNALYIVDIKNEFRYPTNFYESFHNQKWYHMSSVPTSLGCPYQCEFCSPYMPGRYVLRDIATIYNEVSRVRGKTLFLSDATFGLKKEFTISLMEKLAPLEKKILIETTPGRLNDRDILKAVALGGVKWIIIGIETLELKLKKHGSVDLSNGLPRLINRLHEYGILIQGNIICGMDCDGPESFQRISRFIEKTKLDAVMIDLLTPFPNTRLYRRLLKEDRIFDRNWDHYDYHHLVYKPLQMSVDQLINGFIELYSNLSRAGLILSESVRVWKDKGLHTESAIFMGYNLYNKRDAKKKKRALKKNLLHIKRNQKSELLSAYVTEM